LSGTSVRSDQVFTDLKIANLNNHHSLLHARMTTCISCPQESRRLRQNYKPCSTSSAHDYLCLSISVFEDSAKSYLTRRLTRQVRDPVRTFHLSFDLLGSESESTRPRLDWFGTRPSWLWVRPESDSILSPVTPSN